MKKNILIVASVTFLWACNNPSRSTEESGQIEPSRVTEPAESKVGRQNYIVVWEWKTSDKQLVDDNVVKISEETNALWKKDGMENAYWNTQSETNEFENYPNICYVLKAKTLDEAKSTLNEMVLVKEQLASYKIYAIGTSWLGRNTEVIHERAITNSYAAIWSAEKKIDPVVNDSLIIEQNQLILNAYKTGLLENVYWDFEDTYSSPENNNEIINFVFFVNTNSEEDAERICDDLPFTKQGFASYDLYPVGTFWMGKFQE